MPAPNKRPWYVCWSGSAAPDKEWQAFSIFIKEATMIWKTTVSVSRVST